MDAHGIETNALAAAAARDVMVLHQVFEAWLSGRAPRSPEAFRPIEEALAPGFAMVVPDGAPVLLTAEAAAVRYVERQMVDGAATARHALALIEPAPTASGVAWRFVQETWFA